MLHGFGILHEQLPLGILIGESKRASVIVIAIGGGNYDNESSDVYWRSMFAGNRDLSA
jgi:hypothetical protein